MKIIVAIKNQNRTSIGDLIQVENLFNIGKNLSDSYLSFASKV